MLTQAQLGFCTNSTAAYCFYEILPAYYEPEIRLAIMLHNTGAGIYGYIRDVKLPQRV